MMVVLTKIAKRSSKRVIGMKSEMQRECFPSLGEAQSSGCRRRRGKGSQNEGLLRICLLFRALADNPTFCILVNLYGQRGHVITGYLSG